MALQISTQVTGEIIDWELRTFTARYSTHRGSSYNSYLIRDEDCIDRYRLATFHKEFVANLKKEIDLEKIDYIVANHAEIDHSGALPELMRKFPTPYLLTSNGVKSLKDITTGLELGAGKNGRYPGSGEKQTGFCRSRMLHWPDSMFCYLTGEEILFSNVPLDSIMLLN